MKIFRTLFYLLLANTASFPFPTMAALVVRVTDGFTTIVTFDNQIYDSNPEPGSIFMNEVQGQFAGWQGLSVAAISKPVIGSATSPELELTWQVASSGGSNLTIYVSDNGFDVSQSRYGYTQMGGTLGISSNNSVLIRSYYAANNIELIQSTLLTSRAWSGPGAFGAWQAGVVPVDSTISFTLRVDLTQSKGQSSGGKVHFYTTLLPAASAKTYRTEVAPSSPDELVLSSISAHSFSSLQLPVLSSSSAWDLSGLLVDGTIKVGSTMNRPPMRPVQLSSGTNLQLSVPSLTGAKYVLQAATNLNLPILCKRVATNTGTGDVLPFHFTIQPPSTVFFRISVEE